MQVEELYRTLIKFQKDFIEFRYEMAEFRKETKDKLNKQSQTLVGIEDTLNFYGDMYKINTLDKKIGILEAN